MKRWRLILTVFGSFLSIAGEGWSADFQKGVSAYNMKDYVTALSEWSTLAEQGSVSAQFNLGMMYAEGKGVSQDDTIAVRWFMLAAERGNVSAQVNLGFMYQYGKGVTKNEEEAVRWYRLAAEKGNTDAQVNLGLVYRSGKGVIEDHIRSHMWWSIAASQGDQDARERRNNIAKKMTSLQRETSQYLARECVRKMYKGC